MFLCKKNIFYYFRLNYNLYYKYTEKNFAEKNKISIEIYIFLNIFKKILQSKQNQIFLF